MTEPVQSGWTTTGSPATVTVVVAADTTTGALTATVTKATITNTYNKTSPAGIVDKSITKTWADSDDATHARPASVTVHLLADGIDTGKTLELSAANGWEGTFSALAQYNTSGAAIDYTVAEDEVTGYTATITDDGAGNAFAITNTYASTPAAGTSTPAAGTSTPAADTVLHGNTTPPVSLPKTGDAIQPIGIVTLVLIGALALTLGMLCRRRREE